MRWRGQLMNSRDHGLPSLLKNRNCGQEFETERVKPQHLDPDFETTRGQS